MAGRRKRKFSYSEKYAIWHCHGKRCWLCQEPLEIRQMSVDHFLPESLLDDQKNMSDALVEHGLSDDFDINGYENLFPAHRWCNELKGNKIFGYVPANSIVISSLKSKVDEVAKTINNIESSERKSRIFAMIMSDLERGKLSKSDLDSVISMVLEQPFNKFEQSEVLLLSNGHWIFRSQIVREGTCKCERNKCVGVDKKVYCYHTEDQSEWVVTKGLYHRCYDDVIECPRCGRQHKRGHVGSNRFCDSPYRDQDNQCD